MGGSRRFGSIRRADDRKGLCLQGGGIVATYREFIWLGWVGVLFGFTIMVGTAHWALLGECLIKDRQNFNVKFKTYNSLPTPQQLHSFY